ncbi:hypothetical protein M8C21_024110, partial [Ambrosia artemisiifolia]
MGFIQVCRSQKAVKEAFCFVSLIPIPILSTHNVFHEMVNFGVEPSIHTYGALIDGCAKAGQVSKAFGA